MYRVALLPIICTLTACGSGDSENIDSDDLVAEIRVNTFSEGVSFIEVELKSGGSIASIPVELDPNDQLTATVGTLTKVLAEDDDFTEITYSTSFDNDTAGTVFTVSLERALLTSAPNSSVSLPDEFVISLDTVVNNNITFEETLDISWDASAGDDLMALTIEINCQTNAGVSIRLADTFEVPDSGNYSFDLPSFLGSSNIDFAVACTANLNMVRRINGTLDPNFDSGEIFATRSLSTAFNIIP